MPIAAKAEARALVARAIDGAAALPAASRPMITVRTNSAATGLLADDLAAVVRNGLDAIFLPKVESVEQMTGTASLLDRLEAAQGLPAGAVRIIPMFESALGVMRCYELARATPRVVATCIGSARDGDLQTDLGCGWSIEGTELFYARSKILLESRAAGVYALDGVFSDLNDEAGFIQDCALSARLGLHRAHRDTPQADRARAAGVRGVRGGRRLLPARGERVRGGGEDPARRPRSPWMASSSITPCTSGRSACWSMARLDGN